MSVYKNKTGKGWFAKFRYYDWQGKMVYVTKRGFETKRDAQKYEIDFKAKKSGSSSMGFASFAELYLESIAPRVRESTLVTKRNITQKQIIPYFSNKQIDEITATDVLYWQNELLKKINPRTGERFASTYLKTVHSQLSSILNYGVKFYGLRENPAAKVGNIGSEKGLKINFWTTEEYKKFSEVMMDEPMAFYAFEMLYWTGMREGELLALTHEDICLKDKSVSITKTFYHVNGHDVVSDPKTAKSKRVIAMPVALCEEISDYINMIYSKNPTDRLFPITKSYLYKKMKEGSQKAGIKKIRIHDLRHSHISMLINMGYSAVAVADRVGHESITITYRYAHLFPSIQKDMADKLNVEMEGN